MTHTPGDWIAQNDFELGSLVPKSQPWTIYSQVNSTQNGKKYTDDPIAMYVKYKSDACLIASAPLLLAACKAFVEAWEKCLQLEKTDVALQKAKAAIAAAEGDK